MKNSTILIVWICLVVILNFMSKSLPILNGPRAAGELTVNQSHTNNKESVARLLRAAPIGYVEEHHHDLHTAEISEEMKPKSKSAANALDAESTIQSVMQDPIKEKGNVLGDINVASPVYGQYQVLCDLMDAFGTTLTGTWKSCSGSVAPPTPCTWAGTTVCPSSPCTVNAKSCPSGSGCNNIGCTAGLVTDLKLTVTLAGPLPSSIGQMTSLTALVINNAKMTGYLPRTLQSLTNLKTLTIGSNSFKGSLPASAGGMTSLVSLDVSGENSLTGSLPSTLCSIKSLTSVSGNGLTCYPSCLASTPSKMASSNKALLCNPYLSTVDFGILVRNVYANAKVDSLSPQNPTLQYWSNADFCYYFKQTKCDVTSFPTLVSSSSASVKCPPTVFANSIATYCTTFSKLAIGCVPGGAGDDTTASLLEESCLKAYLSTTKTYAVFGSEFDVTNVKQSLLPTTAEGLQSLVVAVQQLWKAAAKLPISSIKVVDTVRTHRSLTLESNLESSGEHVLGDINVASPVYGQYQVLCDLMAAMAANPAVARALQWRECQKEAPTPCTWVGPYGIGCTGGLVTDLRLKDVFVTKTWRLPSSIGQMTSLTSLIIWNTKMTGYLPTTLQFLTSLKTLTIGGNSFTGSLPASAGGMTSLVLLDVSGENSLTGSLPSTLCSVKSLTSVIGNELTCYSSCLASKIYKARRCTYLDTINFGPLVRKAYAGFEINGRSSRLWSNSDFCLFFKQTRCDVNPTLVGDYCPPARFKKQIATYCYSFSKLAIGCVPGGTGNDTTASLLEERCLKDYTTKYPVTDISGLFNATGVSFKFEFTAVTLSKLAMAIDIIFALSLTDVTTIKYVDTVETTGSLILGPTVTANVYLSVGYLGATSLSPSAAPSLSPSAAPSLSPSAAPLRPSPTARPSAPTKRPSF